MEEKIEIQAFGKEEKNKVGWYLVRVGCYLNGNLSDLEKFGS